MPGPRQDIIEQQAELAERVRKLEIMPKSHTIVRSGWMPSTVQLDAIVGHIIMTGCFSSPVGWDHVLPPWVTPAAQYLWAANQQEGYGHNPAIGQHWTRFLQKLGALPPFSSFGPTISMDETGHPPGVEQRGPDDLGFPYATYYYAGIDDAAESSGSGAARVFSLCGMSQQGDEPGVPSVWTQYDRDEGSLPPAPDLIEEGPFGLQRYDGGVVVGPGAMRADYEALIQQGATYMDSGGNRHDCGIPPVPPKDLSRLPGVQIPYDTTFDNYCPNAPGNPFIDGARLDVSYWLPQTDLYMPAPPMPLYPELWGRGKWIKFSALGNNVNPIEYLREWVPYGLAEYPAVADFYQRWLGRALGQQTNTRHHYKHLSLHLSPNWQGRIEVQINDQIAVLRGRVITQSVDLRADTGTIAAWPVQRLPVGPDVVTPGSWPEGDPAYDYLLPYPAQGASHRVTFEARTAGGEYVPMVFNSALNGVIYIGVDNNWMLERDDPGDPGSARRYRQQMELIFDGATIPLQYPATNT